MLGLILLLDAKFDFAVQLWSKREFWGLWFKFLRS